MIEQLLGTTCVPEFLESYLKLPFSLTDAARELIPLGSWETLSALLQTDDLDLMIVRGGERTSHGKPTSLAEARAIFDQGCTLLVRHAERHLPELKSLADGFRADFGGDVDVHLYCTPPGQFGFGWHYDAEEVFIVQTLGRKEYSLRKNTVNPWPVRDTLPANMHHEREIMPLLRCTLQAGDWLYIPSGYWHRAEAEEASISLAIGVMPLTGIDMLDFMRRKALDSLRWRERLPPHGDASGWSREELIAHYAEHFRELAGDLTRIIGEESFVGEFLQFQRADQVHSTDHVDQSCSSST